MQRNPQKYGTQEPPPLVSVTVGLLKATKILGEGGAQWTRGIGQQANL